MTAMFANSLKMFVNFQSFQMVRERPSLILVVKYSYVFTTNGLGQRWQICGPRSIQARPAFCWWTIFFVCNRFHSM